MITENDIKKVAKIRWKSLVERSFNLALAPPDYKTIEDLLLKNFRTGFSCGYCLRELDLHTPYPSASAPSIDHKVPLSEGGTNEKENLFVICHCCNINKGTMPLELFLKELYAIVNSSNPEILQKIFESKMRANLKNKLCRNEQEKKIRERWELK